MPAILPGTPEVIPRRPKVSISLGEKGGGQYGSVVVARKIRESLYQVESAHIPERLKEQFKELSVSIEGMTEQLSKEDAEQLANDLQTLTNEATSEKPRKKWWRLSAQGIRDMADAIGEIGQPVLRTLDSIIGFLENLP